MVKTIKSRCGFCASSRADKSCEVCKEPHCSRCLLTLPTDSFEFIENKPEILSHFFYCPRCFDAHVAPAQEAYDETLAKGKEVRWIPKNYRGLVPVQAKAQKPVEVKDYADRDRALLALGFKASLLGFNSLVRAELTGKKLLINGYSKTLWSGHGVPANLNVVRLDLDSNE